MNLFSKKIRATSQDTSLYSHVSAVWITSLFIGYFLAIAGLFAPSVIFILITIVTLSCGIFLWKFRPSPSLTTISGALFLFALTTAFISTPSVFSGRDQGSYSQAAIRLSTEHTITSSIPNVSHDFFTLYGEGQALHFPGFFYTEDGQLTPQFPLGSIVWFAMNFSLFGLWGFSIANAFTLFLGLVSTFLIARRFLPLAFAIGAVMVTAFSFPLLWLTQNTLSENLAWTLFLIAIFHLISFLKKPERLSWWLTVSALMFLLLTRIEGYLIVPMAILLILSQSKARSFLMNHIFSTIVPALALLITCISCAFIFNRPFFITIGKALFGSDNMASISEKSPFFFTSIDSLIRTTEIFWQYNMIPVFILAFFGIVFVLAKKQFLRSVSFFLTLPTFIYLISPHISADHPWMLRRFAFSIWPISILFAFFALDFLQRRLHQYFPEKIFFRPIMFAVFSSCLLVVATLPKNPSLILSSENTHLLEDTRHLSETFSTHDLILIDRLASGDPYSMIADPMSTLFHKNAVYFFNPHDLSKINTSRFDHIYLLVQDTSLSHYTDILSDQYTFTPVREYSLRTSTISRSIDPSTVPYRESSLARGTIFLLEKL